MTAAVAVAALALVAPTLWADWTHLVSGYPNTWIGSLSPVIADLDGTGGPKEIVLLTQGNPNTEYSALVILESNGDERAFVELSNFCGARSLASVADLDRDGTLEIVATCGGSAGEKMTVFDHFGTIEDVIDTTFDNSDELYSCVVIDDLDRVPGYELAYMGWSMTGTRLVVMDTAGTDRPGFPIMLEDTQTSQGSTPAVADLDGVGPRDLAVSTFRRDPDGQGGYIYTSHLAAYSGDGVELWRHDLPGMCWADPAIGDLDCDRRNEVVATTETGLHIIESDGSLQSLVTGVGLAHSNVALADLDGDSDLEILFGYGTRLYALHHDGGELFTFVPDWLPHHPPVVGDVNGDGGLDVVFNSDDEVYALDAAGNLLAGFPLPLQQTIAYNAPAIDDVDGDGQVELVSCSNWGGTGEIDYGIVHLWDLSSAYSPATMPWPTFQRAPAHPGRYEAPPFFADDFETGNTSAWSEVVP